MIHKLLFRGKNIKTGEWAFGILCAEPSYNSSVYSMQTPDGLIVDVAKLTVGQYIGRDDDNEIKMFSDDIIKVDLFESEYHGRFKLFNEQTSLLGKIAYNPIRCAFCIYFEKSQQKVLFCEFAWGGEKFTVEGNIHDNPTMIGRTYE